jgi:mucin-6/19
LLGISGSACNTTRYVQIRTRSSSTDTSDLKDATPTFTYSFGGPTAAAQLSTECATQTFANPTGNPTFTYNSTGSADSTGSTSGLTYDWSIDVSPTTVALSGGGATATATPGHYTSSQPSGTVTANLSGAGVPSAVITVVNTVNDGGCPASTGSKVVTVYAALAATATLTPHCNNTFDFSSTVSGGKAPYTYSWSFQKNTNDNGSGTWNTFPITGGASFTSGTATSDSGTVATGVQGAFRGVLTVTDTAGDCGGSTCATGVTPKDECTATATSAAINVYNAVGGTVALTPDCDNTFTYLVSPTGGKAPYSFAYTLEKLVASSWTTSSTWTSSSASGAIDIDNPVSPPAGTNTGGNLNPAGPGRYRLRVTISDSQSPPCTFATTSNEIDVRDPLSVSAAKNSTNTSNMSVQVNSSATNGFSDTITYAWSKSTDNSTFTAIANSNVANLTYSSFESDDTSPDSQTFTIGSGPGAGTYDGKVYVVYLKVTITRTLNGIVCSATSNVVIVKKVVAVDP